MKFALGSTKIDPVKLRVGDLSLDGRNAFGVSAAGSGSTKIPFSSVAFDIPATGPSWETFADRRIDGQSLPFEIMFNDEAETCTVRVTGSGETHLHKFNTDMCDSLILVITDIKEFNMATARD